MPTSTGNPKSNDFSRSVSDINIEEQNCLSSTEQCIERPTRWATHHLNPLPSYVSGRVALLGDAVSSRARPSLVSLDRSTG